MKQLRLFSFLIFLCLALNPAWSADDIVQLTIEGVANISAGDDAGKAQNDAVDDALNKGALQVITDLIGQPKVEKNYSVIKGKILSQKSKFIQFYKASDPTKRGNETVVSVNMKISASSLRDLLSAEGLMYQSEGPATVLPVIKISERRNNGKQFRWWMEEAQPQHFFMRDQVRVILHQFDGVLRAKNFYLIDPVTQHYAQWVPEPFMHDPLTMEDVLWMGDFFKAQMVIQGEVILEPAEGDIVKANIKLVGYHTSNGRVVGEVTRTIESNPGEWEMAVQQLIRKAFSEVVKDFAGQVFDEWTRGTFGASLLQVTLRGSMSPADIDTFKKQILSKVSDVKTIRERRLERGQFTFEVDASGGMSNLVKRLYDTSFDGFKVSTDTPEGNHVVLRWSRN